MFKVVLLSAISAVCGAVAASVPSVVSPNATTAHAKTSNEALLSMGRYGQLTNTTVLTQAAPSPAHNLTERATKGCFPALGFNTPRVNSYWEAPSTPLNQWRCNEEDERGFLGFSYYTSTCQSYDELYNDFRRMRTEFNARYVRLYSWCDAKNDRYPADVVLAAYRAGLGVYFTIWFGFDGTSDWVWRRDTLIWVIQNIPLARYVIRSIDVGSEPLYDWAIDPNELAGQIWYLKSVVNQYGIQVSTSEMKWGFELHGGGQNILDAVDAVHAHHLPFFYQDATVGSAAWPTIQSETEWFRDRTWWGKKIIFTQTGWPTNADTWPGNSPNAVASAASAKAYVDLLDSHCKDFKYLHGGVGWFWQIYADEMLPGWGLLGANGKPKFKFAPKTDC